MAVQQTIQLVGSLNAAPAEVEVGTKALRANLRSKDFGVLGDYSIAGRSTPVSASTSAVGGIYFGIFWEHMLHVCVVERISVSSVLTISGTGSVGNYTATLTRARYAGELGAMLFNAAAGNAASVLYPTTIASGGTGKLDDGVADSSAIVAIAANAAINGFAFPTNTGSFYLEATGISAIVGSVPLVSGSRGLGLNGDLWNTAAGDYPLTLSGRGQCLLIQFAAPTASVAQTIDFGASVTWREVEIYP